VIVKRIPGEVIEREHSQVMTVGWIGEGIRAGEMRGHYVDHGPVPADALKLLHRGHGVRQVLDDIRHPDFIERIVL
jgi:hypothetical protein